MQATSRRRAFRSETEQQTTSISDRVYPVSGHEALRQERRLRAAGNSSQVWLLSTVSVIGGHIMMRMTSIRGQKKARYCVWVEDCLEGGASHGKCRVEKVTCTKSR